MPTTKADRHVGVTIEGLDEIEQMLNNLSENGADKAIRKAMRAGAKVMQAAIEENAPERLDALTPGSSGLPPGAIAHDINIGQVRVNEAKNYTVSVGPGKFTEHIAMFVEYGHAAPSGEVSLLSERIKVNGNGKPTPAHPFLRPAWDSAEDAAEAALQASLEADVAAAIDGDGNVAGISEVA